MLNRAVKNENLASLKSAQSEYEAQSTTVCELSTNLFQMRRRSSEQIMTSVEQYINTLANSPKEFDKTFSVYRAEYQSFDDIVVSIEEEANKANVKAGVGASSGIAAGTAVGVFAPTAAMSIATTFGTASTGAAISGLSGAAANSAALAWLGGGALAAGGGGMTAGSALLALAGPIGWTLGGTALLASGMFARKRNQKIAENAATETKKIQTHVATLKAAKVEVDNLLRLTEKHVNGINDVFALLKDWAPNNYLEFSSLQKEWLSALINHIQSLSQLLNKKVQA